MRFESRVAAGILLSERLTKYAGEDPIVVALPRGGVVVGSEIAKAIQAPLGVVVVQKLGHQYNPEYAIGAIAEDSPPVMSQTENVDATWLKSVVVAARREITKRKKLYAVVGYPLQKITGKMVILTDDGIATGLTMQAAAMACRALKPNKLIVAVPVASTESTAGLIEVADEVITLDDPGNFVGFVAGHYKQFEQVENSEVIDMLEATNIET